MVHKIKKRNGFIEWGFDLTQVSSDEAFLNLLKQFGFKEIKPKKVDPFLKKMFRGRFKTFHNTFQNPDRIKITVEHMGGTNSDKGFLGYIGIKAPKKSLPKLKKFLEKFRGKKTIKITDWTGRNGIARYVKQETPFEGGFIGVG